METSHSRSCSSAFLFPYSAWSSFSCSGFVGFSWRSGGKRDDYNYDGAGKLESITYPSGRVVTYQRDAAGQVSSVSMTPAGGTATTLASQVAHAPFGPITSLAYGNGLTFTRSLDHNDLYLTDNFGSSSMVGLGARASKPCRFPSTFRKRLSLSGGVEFTELTQGSEMKKKRKQKELSMPEGLASMPWWTGAAFCSVFLLISLVLPWYLALSCYFVAFLAFLGTIGSIVRQYMNGQLLDTQARRGRNFRNLNWREFERLCQEAFRRLGYLSIESDPGPDGGWDIVLRKEGKKYLVQCKHWKYRPVGVAPVRELMGVVAAGTADGGIFVTSSYFTEEAAAFAKRSGIELIDGRSLAKIVGEVRKGSRQQPQAASMKPTASETNAEAKQPLCPKCGGGMVLRAAKKGKKAGQPFWGCSAFPKCWGRVVPH